MEHLGWTYADIQAECTVHQATTDQVRNRQIDAIVWPDAPGSASIQEIVDTGFGKVLSVDEDLIQYMADQGLDDSYTLPAGSVPGTDLPIVTFASPVTFSTPWSRASATASHHPRPRAGRHRRPLRLLCRLQLFRHRHARRLPDPDRHHHWHTIFCLTVLEAARRIMGMFLVILAAAFLAYLFLGPHLPGVLAHGGFSFTGVIRQMYMSTEGVFGIAVGVSATYVLAQLALAMPKRFCQASASSCGRR